MRPLALALLLAAAGCAVAPRAWQNPTTGAFATAEEISACQGAAQVEAQRSVFADAGFAGFGFGWGRRGYYPGWGWGYTPGVSLNLAILQRAQDLTAFCLRLKGYALLPVRPEAGAVPPSGDAQAPQPAAPKP